MENPNPSRPQPSTAPDQGQAAPAPDGDRAALERRLAQLEGELAAALQELAGVRAERDAFRQSYFALLRDQFTEEELRRFATDDNEEGCQALDQFIGELEAVVKNGKRA